MCGLVGMVGTLEYRHKKAMADLLFLDTLRGKDSTGLATVNRKREYQLRKMPIPGYEFIEHPGVEKMMSHQDQLWIGHNRFKTTGDISKANAHPFVVTDNEDNALLIGAHNGTLDNKFEIERNLDKKYDTDSEGLFNLLVKAPNFKEGISKLRGAWSLVFWDPSADQINFVRNKERPLVFAFTKDRKVMVWASEAWMILAACRRNDIELDTNDKGQTCWSTLPDHLYSMEIPQRAGDVLPELKREGGYAGQARFFQGGGNFKNWWDGYKDEPEDDNIRYITQRQKEEEERKKEDEKDAEDEKKLVTLGLPPGTRRGFEGQPITDKEFAEVKKNGCGWCGDPIGNVWCFIEEKTMVCNNCLHDSHPKARDCVRPEEDNDNPPFDLGEKRDTLQELGKAQSYSENSEEYKQLMAASVRAAQKTVG